MNQICLVLLLTSLAYTTGSLLRKLIRIVRRSATKKLGNDVTKERNCIQLGVEEHGQRHGRVDVAAAVASDEEDDKRQRTTDNQRIATARKDSEDKKERTDVFRKVVREVHSTW